VNAFSDVFGHDRQMHWYVNFQRPASRTAIGFDTFDLPLDLVVAPDLSRWDWKDEAEYAHGRRLGVVSQADHQAVERARCEAVAMLESRGGPFAAGAGWNTWSTWDAWRSESDSPAPSLSGDVLAVHS
jgi:hypothetical protein